MREFWTRAVSVILIAAALLGYNIILDTRAKNEQIAQLSAQVDAMEGSGEESHEASSPDRDYKDGTYTGEAQGFGGPVSVEVVIDGGKITEINILSADNEDGAYLAMAQDIIPAIIDAQTTDVDTISGATFSSGGIKDAAAQALEKAGK